MRAQGAWQLAALCLVLLLAPVPGVAVVDPLAPTTLVQSDHPRIRALAAELTRGAESSRERAVRIHRFVRDEIAFGWTRSFYRMSAVEVLDARIGYCNTKATVFLALLRAAGIPARQHFVDISSLVLAGFLERGRSHVDHSYVEVLLGGRWLRVDSYVVDAPLFEWAARALARTGEPLGFGIHRSGTIEWDGASDSFIQFVDDGSVPDLTTTDHGIFRDTEDFYRQRDGADKLAGIHRLAIPLLIPRATQRAERLRKGGV
jgi:hypothetical protein